MLFLPCPRLSLPLTVAGVWVSCLLHHCLLCLWRESFITGGNVPGWIRFVSGWPLCQGSRGSASSQVVFQEQNLLCVSRQAREAALQEESFRNVFCVHLLRSRRMSGHDWFQLPAISENSTGWPSPYGFTLGSDWRGPWLTFVFC